MRSARQDRSGTLPKRYNNLVIQSAQGALGFAINGGEIGR